MGDFPGSQSEGCCWDRRGAWLWGSSLPPAVPWHRASAVGDTVQGRSGLWTGAGGAQQPRRGTGQGESRWGPDAKGPGKSSTRKSQCQQESHRQLLSQRATMLHTEGSSSHVVNHQWTQSSASMGALSFLQNCHPSPIRKGLFQGPEIRGLWTVKWLKDERTHEQTLL